MQAVKLVKRRSTGYHGGRDVHAYGAEFDTDGFVDGVKKILHDGAIDQDSTSLGQMNYGITVNSPVKYDTTSGKLSVTVGPITVWTDYTGDGTLPKQPDPPMGCLENPFVHCK